MARYEYKVIELKPDMWTGGVDGFEKRLNTEGNGGWRLAHLLGPNQSLRGVFILVFERDTML